MKIEELRDKFIYSLGSVYDAEHQFLAAQQSLLQQVSNADLQASLQQHIQESQQQIRNLEQVFRVLNMSPQLLPCEAAVGLLIEGQQAVQQASGDPALLDCAIAGAQSKIEHFEIASYRSLVIDAKVTEQEEALLLLQQNLQQEENAARNIENLIQPLMQAVTASAGK